MRSPVPALLAIPLAWGITAASEQSAQLTDESLIIDEADILDSEGLVEEINGLDDAEVRIGVFTSDEADEDDYDATITERLVELDPDGLIEDGELADDAVVVVLSPELRQLGIYSGDDAEDAEPSVASVTEAMTLPAQDADWNEAARVGVQTYLDETYHRQETSSPSDGIDVPWGIAGLVVAGMVLSYGIAEMISTARSRRRFIANYPASRPHVDEAYRLFVRIRDANTSEIPTLPPSAKRMEIILTSLADVRRQGYVPSKQIAKDRATRRWTDDLSTANQIMDQIEVVEFTQKGHATWSAQIRPEIEELAENQRAAAAEVDDYPFEEDEAVRLRRAAHEAAESITELVEQVEQRTITAYRALADAEDQAAEFTREATRVARSIPQSRRGDFVSVSDRDDSSLVLWPALYAVLAVSTTSTSSSSGSSTSTTSFSAGGFSGGSAGF